MIRYQIIDMDVGDQRVELNLMPLYSDKSPQEKSLVLNPLAGGMRGETLKRLEEHDFVWIDFQDSSETFTGDNASRIRRIYSQKREWNDSMDLIYER